MKAMMIDLIKEKKYGDAAEIFEKTPILNYQSEKPIFELDVFEFSLKENKNPVFLRVLINYISLLNILLDQNLTPTEFHKALSYFSAKFSYEMNEGYLKLILMAKTTIEVYNLIFNEGSDKIYENFPIEVKNSIDLKFDQRSEESTGYTYQELGRTFLNDYVVGRNKGSELPNLLFYIKSIDKIQNLIGVLFYIPHEMKLNLKEKHKHTGINEFDNIIVLKEDMKIDQNNPYFRYLKTVQGSKTIYSDLELKKNVIYILEFKHAYRMDTKIASIQEKGNNYMELYNKNVYDVENSFHFSEYKILYFYNYLENLGYKNILSFNLNLDIWKFLYLSPSCQIAQVTNLSSKVLKLEKKVAELEKKTEEKFDKIEALLAQKKPEVKNIFNNIEKKDGFSITRDTKFQIEEEFKDLSKKIKNKNELNIFNKLFTDYELEIHNFVEPEEKFEINKDIKWDYKFEGEIQDDKTCFEIMAPCIGCNKVSSNYKKIQKYIFAKIEKNDEMSEIYQYIYYCFYGRRKLEDKSSNEKFYPNEIKIQKLLINIIKYTFYCDRKRNEKGYYLLSIFKELLNEGDKAIKDTIFQLRNKTLYQLVLMSLDLINVKSGSNRSGYIECPTKNHI